MIVDLIGLADQLKPALATYTDSGGHGSPVIDTAQAVAVLLEKYEVCCDLMHGFDWSKWMTYALRDKINCDLQLEPSIIAAAAPYPPDSKPVFVGHYWLSGSRPELLAANVACVDYSVAKGGFLCAYRWNGEQKLDNNNFIWTGKKST